MEYQHHKPNCLSIVIIIVIYMLNYLKCFKKWAELMTQHKRGCRWTIPCNVNLISVSISVRAQLHHLYKRVIVAHWFFNLMWWTIPCDFKIVSLFYIMRAQPSQICDTGFITPCVMNHLTWNISVCSSLWCIGSLRSIG